MQAVRRLLGRKAGEGGETGTRGRGPVRVGVGNNRVGGCPVDGGTVRLCVPRSSIEVVGQVARRGAACSVQKCDAGQDRAGQDRKRWGRWTLFKCG